MAKRYITTTETERETLETDHIEAILLKHFARKGWTVKFDWQVGQWVSLDVERTRTQTVESDVDPDMPF